jgi:hypothetical protein
LVAGALQGRGHIAKSEIFLEFRANQGDFQLTPPSDLTYFTDIYVP